MGKQDIQLMRNSRQLSTGRKIHNEWTYGRSEFTKCYGISNDKMYAYGSMNWEGADPF